MYYVYILKSKRDSKLYIGYSDNLNKRFLEHQNGKVESTRDRRPLEIFYYEAYNSKGMVQDRERQLKKFGSAYAGLIKRIDAGVV